MTVPVIGPVVVVGHFAAIILTALEGAVVLDGLSALGASLYSIGIPNDTIINYEQALKADGFMVLVQSTKEETERAHTILKGTNARQVDLHCSQGIGKNDSGEIKKES